MDPRLALGLLRLPPFADGEITEEEANAAIRVAKLVRGARSDKELALGLDILAAQVTRRKTPTPAIDGSLSDWLQSDLLAADPQGDVVGSAGAGVDLAELYAVIVGDQLFVAWRTHGTAATGRHSFWVELRAEPTHGTIAIGVGAGNVTLIRAMPGRKPVQLQGTRTKVEWAAGDVVEAKIPLSWLRRARRVRISGFSFDGQTGTHVDRIAEQEPVADVDDGYVPGLLALFDLATAMPFEPNDRLALAVALASSDVYAIGGTELAGSLAEDCKRLLIIGRRQRDAQKERGWPPLDTLPLQALLTWASRSVQYRPSTAAGYVRYSVSPEVLAGMARYAAKNGLVQATVLETVEGIERHLGNPKRWQYTSAAAVERGARLARGQGASLSDQDRRDLDKFVRSCHIDGVELTTDGNFNQDLLFDHLVATDALVGHCGNMAQTVVEMCRSLGIPATIVQGREETSTLFANPHAFPTYFDGESRTWRSIQGRRYEGGRALAVYFFLPPALTRLPERARSAGGGTHWYRTESTYDDVGTSFRRGSDLAWYRAWLESLR
ncbi:transglutaminase domain-containing protein [Planctomycetota bacterium]